MSVGPKKRETYRQRVLQFAPTPLVAEILCPEATAIADMEAEWVRTSPSAIVDLSQRFGKRLQDGDMNLLKQLQQLEQEYLHGKVETSMNDARKCASHQFQKRFRMVLGNGS